MASDLQGETDTGKRDSSEVLAERAVEHAFPNATVANVADVSGLVKTTCIVQRSHEDDLVVSYCADEELETSFESELETIEFVAERTNLPVPTVYHDDFEGDAISHPCMITERLPGYNPNYRFKYLPVETKRKILRQIGRCLGELHDETFDAFGTLTRSTDGLEVAASRSWRDTLVSILDRQLDGMADGPFDDLRERVRATVLEHQALLEVDDSPSLLHHDLRPANVLVEGDVVTGIVDWERALAGHAEFDLFETERNFLDIEFHTEQARTRVEDALFEGYRSRQDLRSGWKRRRALYRIVYLTETMWFYPKIPEKKLPVSPEEIRAQMDHRIRELDRLCN